MSRKRLPPGWTEARLPEVVEINPPNPDVAPDDDAPVSFVPMAAVQVMAGGIDTSETRQWRKVRKGYKRFQDGDVLFAKITPCMENGKLAVANGLHNGVGAGSTEFHVLRPSAAIRSDLLAYYLLQDDFRASARAKMKGTAGQLRVPEQFLESQTLPVPPLRDQKRIVETIDSYFTRLNDVTVTLERVRRNLKRYRASILKAAVEGRLVPTEAELARAEGRDYEPASVLLERILTERRRRWEEAELKKMKAAGKTPKNDKWKAKYKEPTAPDIKALPLLPEGWCWARLDAIADVAVGQQRHPRYQTGRQQSPYLRAANITWSGLDLRDIKTMRFPDRNRFMLKSGDVLLSEASGSPMEAGKPVIWRDEIPGACFQNTILRVRPVVNALVKSEYLHTVFLSNCLEGKFVRLAPGVGIVHISAGRLSKWAIPLAPVPDQNRVVEALDTIDAPDVASRNLPRGILGRTESAVTRQLARCIELRQSLLSYAFNGRFVDQFSSE